MIRFTHDSTTQVFSAVDFDGFKNLMFDAANGIQEKDEKTTNDKIREVMFQILGVEEGCSRRQIWCICWIVELCCCCCSILGFWFDFIDSIVL